MGRSMCANCERIVFVQVRRSRERTTVFRGFILSPLLITVHLELKTFCLSPGSMVCEAWDRTVHTGRMGTAWTGFQVCGFKIQILV